MFKSRNRSVEQRQNRKLKILKAVLTVSCALIFCCALFQSIQLLTFCGRDFRISYAFDSRIEQLCMIFIEVLLAIAGIVGIYWRKAGPLYFVGVSFILCTVMVVHLVDFVMGIIYMFYKQGTRDGVEQFLTGHIEKYKDGNKFSIKKLNKVQRCMECCGLEGPGDGSSYTGDSSGNELIPSCCPNSEGVSCTIQNAYKEGCVNKLKEAEATILSFHVISSFTIVCEFFTYQTFLRCFV